MRYYFFIMLSLIFLFLAIGAIAIIQINPQKNIWSQLFLSLFLLAVAALFYKMKILTGKEILQKIKEELKSDYI